MYYNLIIVLTLIFLLSIFFVIIYYCYKRIKKKADKLIFKYKTYKMRSNIIHQLPRQNHAKFGKSNYHLFFQFLKHEPGLSFAERLFLFKQLFIEELFLMRLLSITGILLSLSAILVTFLLFLHLRLSLVAISSGCFVVIVFYILGSFYLLIKAKNIVLYTIYSFEEVDKKQDEITRIKNKHKTSINSIKQKKQQDLESQLPGKAPIEPIVDYECGANSFTPENNINRQNLAPPIKVKLISSGVFEQDNDGHFILYLEPGGDSGVVYPGDDILGGAIEPAMEKKLSSAFDFLLVGIGHYEMVSKAKISWSADKKRGKVKEKGQIKK